MRSLCTSSISSIQQRATKCLRDSEHLGNEFWSFFCSSSSFCVAQNGNSTLKLSNFVSFSANFVFFSPSPFPIRIGLLFPTLISLHFCAHRLNSANHLNSLSAILSCARYSGHTSQRQRARVLRGIHVSSYVSIETNVIIARTHRIANAIAFSWMEVQKNVWLSTIFISFTVLWRNATVFHILPADDAHLPALHALSSGWSQRKLYLHQLLSNYVSLFIRWPTVITVYHYSRSGNRIARNFSLAFFFV